MADANAPMMQLVMSLFESNTNPRTIEGLKLFLKAMESVPDDERIKIFQDNAREIVKLFENLSSSFGWGQLLTQVNISSANDGSCYKMHKHWEIAYNLGR